MVPCDRNTTRWGSFAASCSSDSGWMNDAPTTSVRIPAGSSATSDQYEPKDHSSSGWSATTGRPG